ncbi:MAG: indole-3-glycerol phosphate synthase TrpC [Neisseriaceae bacterium]|nr:MAG: indole-3-glycerol phosphate synthase TrpC [Neisseriaceae bacterium]
MDILTTINEAKKQEVSRAKEYLDFKSLKSQCLDIPSPRDFSGALRSLVSQEKTTIIAEIKKASPSRGLIREHFDPIDIAQSYERSGAACLSILTDVQYFQGNPKYISQVKSKCNLPILRKDFIIDAYQIYQSKLWQADAVLLIAASLSQSQLEDFEGIALENGLSALIEIHAEEELKKIESLKSPLIGINNRNLKNFEVNIERTLALKPFIPKEKIIICESGIHDHDDIKHMRENGIYAFLVGESLMRQDKLDSALLQLINGK